MGLKRIRRPLGTVTDKRVGNLEIMERKTPRGFNLLEVYADTETGYQTDGLKPWEWIGKPEGTNVLSELIVHPLIISGQYRRRRHNRSRSSTYEAGGYVRRTVFINCLDAFEVFLEDMAMVYNEWRFTPVVYFHNSSYDIPMIEPLLKVLDEDIILYSYVKPTDKGFIRGAFESPKYNVFWEFGDTLQYDKTISISKAGEMLGKPKIKGIPYGLCDVRVEGDDFVYEDLHTGETKSYPIKKYLEYAENDVTIMRELNERRYRNMNKVNEIMIEDWDKMKHEIFNKYCITVSTHSKRIANTYLKRNGGTDIDTTFRFNLKDVDLGDFKDLYQRTVESNCGGYTSYNRRFSRYDCGPDKHIKYYDRNSMYPTIMTEEIPYGDILKEPPEGSYVTWYCISIRFLCWNEPMDLLKDEAFGQAKRNGVPFFVLKEYLDFVIAHSTIDYSILGTYYQRKEKILAGLINSYYERRKEIKRIMDRMESEGEKGTPKYIDLDDKQSNLKLLMNSLYGKMCEKGRLIECVYAMGEYHEFENEEEYYPCILTASYITYKSRLCLLEKIKAVIESGYDFLYADTDSVVLGCPKEADLTPIFGVNEGKLGQWKLEGTYDLFLHNGARKKYVLFDRSTEKHKIALSGIPKSICELITDKIKVDFKGGVRDMEILFNPKGNVVIRKGKVAHLLSRYGSRQIIYNTDFQMNSRRGEPLWEIKLQPNNYTITKCAEK